MEIGVILRILGLGGVPKIAINEVRTLTSKNVKTELLVYRVYNYPLEFQRILGVAVRRFDKGLLRYIAGFFAKLTQIFLPIGRELESTVDITTMILAPLFMSKRDQNILLCMDQLAGISGFIAGKKGVPYFVYVHEPLFVSSLLGILKISRFRIIGNIVGTLIYKIEKTVLTYSTGIFFNSKGTFQWMIKYFPFIKNKGIVIYPGCNPIDRLPEKRKNFILTVSRWDRVKYPTFILDLAERVPADFVIAGSWTPPSLLNDFISKVHERKLDKKIRILTNLSERELKNLFLRAKIYVHWVSEGFSMGVLEAMAHGLPVVTRRGAGVSELITHGFNGFIVEEPSRVCFIAMPLNAHQRKPCVDKYVEILEALLNDPKLCEWVGKNAWGTSKDYCWKEHTNRLLEIVRSKLKNKFDISDVN